MLKDMDFVPKWIWEMLTILGAIMACLVVLAFGVLLVLLFFTFISDLF